MYLNGKTNSLIGVCGDQKSMTSDCPISMIASSTNEAFFWTKILRLYTSNIFHNILIFDVICKGVYSQTWTTGRSSVEVALK